MRLFGLLIAIWVLICGFSLVDWIRCYLLLFVWWFDCLVGFCALLFSGGVSVLDCFAWALFCGLHWFGLVSYDCVCFMLLVNDFAVFTVSICWFAGYYCVCFGLGSLCLLFCFWLTLFSCD